MFVGAVAIAGTWRVRRSVGALAMLSIGSAIGGGDDGILRKAFWTWCPVML
jgi:hypothetical protein